MTTLRDLALFCLTTESGFGVDDVKLAFFLLGLAGVLSTLSLVVCVVPLVTAGLLAMVRLSLSMGVPPPPPSLGRLKKLLPLGSMLILILMDGAVVVAELVVVIKKREIEEKINQKQT